MNGEYLFKLAVGKLGLDFTTYDLLTPYELVILDHQKYEDEKATFKLVQTALWMHEVSKSKGKFKSMYLEDDGDKQKVSAISEEQRKEELEALRRSFGLEA